jgi:hypothetical protein
MLKMLQHTLFGGKFVSCNGQIGLGYTLLPYHNNTGYLCSVLMQYPASSVPKYKAFWYATTNYCDVCLVE